MKRLLLALLCICLLAAASVVSADETAYKVTYAGNNCLASVPTDEKEYKAGEQVTVLFDPVTYTDGLIFYGWDMNNDGVADFGYAYNKFNMPANDVELKAICITPYYGPVAPGPRPGPGPHPGPMPEPFPGPQPAPGPQPVPGPVPGPQPLPPFPWHF